MTMERANQPFGKVARRVIINVNHRGDAVAFGDGVLRGLQDPRSGQVSNGFRSVLIAPRLDDLIQIIHEIVVDRDSDALHGGSPSCCGPDIRADNRRRTGTRGACMASHSAIPGERRPTPSLAGPITWPRAPSAKMR